MKNQIGTYLLQGFFWVFAGVFGWRAAEWVVSLLARGLA